MDPVAGSGACGEGVLDPLDCADEVFGDGSFNRWTRKCYRCGCGLKRVYSSTVA